MRCCCLCFVVLLLLRYLEDNVKALGVKLTAEEVKNLTDAVPLDKVGGGIGGA